jgi:predicted DsbA family dithiol-disulfide isomerase
MASTLNIRVTFDLICPWCWIAKRNLENALTELHQNFPDQVIRLDWRGVQFIPNTPEEGLSFVDFYSARLGSEAQVRLHQDRIGAIAAQAGLQMNFDQIKVFPNTLKAHRLLARSKSLLSAAQFDDLLEALFSAYFFEGKNIGDCKVLTDIAARFDINPLLVNTAITSSLPESYVQPAVSSIPHIVLNDRRRLVGAQSVGTLVSSFSQIIKDELVHEPSLPPSA